MWRLERGKKNQHWCWDMLIIFVCVYTFTHTFANMCSCLSKRKVNSVPVLEGLMIQKIFTRMQNVTGGRKAPVQRGRVQASSLETCPENLQLK